MKLTCFPSLSPRVDYRGVKFNTKQINYCRVGKEEAALDGGEKVSPLLSFTERAFCA